MLWVGVGGAEQRGALSEEEISMASVPTGVSPHNPEAFGFWGGLQLGRGALWRELPLRKLVCRGDEASVTKLCVSYRSP